MKNELEKCFPTVRYVIKRHKNSGILSMFFKLLQNIVAEILDVLLRLWKAIYV